MPATPLLVQQPSAWLILSMWLVKCLFSTYARILHARLGPSRCKLWAWSASQHPFLCFTYQKKITIIRAWMTVCMNATVSLRFVQYLWGSDSRRRYRKEADFRVQQWWRHLARSRWTSCFPRRHEGVAIADAAITFQQGLMCFERHSGVRRLLPIHR